MIYTSLTPGTTLTVREDGLLSIVGSTGLRALTSSSLLLRALQRSQEHLKQPWNMLDVSVVQLAVDAGGSLALMSLQPPMVREVEYLGLPQVWKIPVFTLWTWTITGGEINKERIYVADPTDDLVDGRFRIGRFPYGNVDSLGIPCWGANEPPAFPALRQRQECFWSWGFNQDLCGSVMVDHTSVSFSANDIPPQEAGIRVLPMPRFLKAPTTLLEFFQSLI